MTPQTVLIGLDGATFAILEPLMDDGVMPFLKEFAGSGCISNWLLNHVAKSYGKTKHSVDQH